MLGVWADVALLVGAHGIHFVNLVFRESYRADTAQAQTETQQTERGERQNQTSLARQNPSPATESTSTELDKKSLCSFCASGLKLIFLAGVPEMF
jgi:hypothetical protein